MLKLAPLRGCLPHDKPAKHSAMDVALLRLTHKCVMHGGVTYQHGIAGAEGRHISHCSALSQ